MSTTTTGGVNATQLSTRTPPATAQAALDVSLEDHLVDLLRPLLPVLPASLHHDLAALLEASDDICSADSPKTRTTRTISYSLLLSISTWTRSDPGKAALQGRSPPLHPNAYTMVSLLSGTRTSPDRKFPNVAEAVDPAQEAQRTTSDRRAITALVNALLSIIGSGVAVWVAADKLHWKNEWRVLLALFSAMVVAITEGVLFLIWDSRHSKSKTTATRRIHKFAKTRRARKTSDANLDDSKAGSGDNLVPSAGSLEQSREQNPLIEDSHPGTITVVPPAKSNIQLHSTAEGLRERVGGR